MDINIIFEDEDFIVIDKPFGIVVNKSDSAKEETIQDWAEEKLGIKNYELRINNETDSEEQRIIDEFLSRGGVVHRLDKETSGILLIAKNPQSFLNLKTQFKERQVEKSYLALSHGEIKPGTGSIDAPVGRLPFNRTKFGVIPGGRDAVTHYEVLNYYKYNNESLSYLRLIPKTGRTHQIRVHLKHLGHPIFSDPLYVGRKAGREDRKVLPRLFLHAEKISINHPGTGDRLTFDSLLPESLQNFLNGLAPIDK